MPRVSAFYGIAHQSELPENWVRARHHQSLNPIEPLR